MRVHIVMLVACAVLWPRIFLTRSADAQAVADNTYYSQPPQDLQSLVAPVALYPDAMLAQIMVACTYPEDVISAAQYLDGGNDPNLIDQQGWDLSVAGVARYPDLLHYMAGNVPWMNSLGSAFLNQQADVMSAVQVMRSEALAAGTLVSNEYQQVVVDGGTIEILPTDPNNIYPPIYDPALAYQRPTFVIGGVYAPLIRYWHGIPCGIWLHHDIDWQDHRVYVGSWGVDRPWWHHDGPDGRWDYTHDRPGLHPFQGNIDVHEHEKVVHVRGGEWNRQMHDPVKPMPKFTPRQPVHQPVAHPGTGYEPREAQPSHVNNPPAIHEYNHAPTVTEQRDRGRVSRTTAGIKTAPIRPAEVPARHAVPAPPSRVEPSRTPPRVEPSRTPPRVEPSRPTPHEEPKRPGR